jgi:putative transposase
MKKQRKHYTPEEKVAILRRQGYVEHYNNVRLNSAVGYITPKDMLAGRQQEIHAEQDRKLEEARKQRQVRRQKAA